MLDERYDRRRHRRAMTAVLGCTAVIAIGGALLVAPAADATVLGGVLSGATTVVNQVTAPLGTTAPTTTAGTSTGTVGALLGSVTAPVASVVAGTTGVNLAPTVAAATTPVTTSVDSLLAPLTGSGSTTTTPPVTTAPSVAAIVSGATTPVTTAVAGTTGVDLTPTLTAVTTPVTTTVDSVLAPVTGSGAPTGTAVTVAPTTVGPILTGTTTALSGTIGTLVGALSGAGTSSSIVDLTGSGSGLVNTGSTNGLVGISIGSNGLSVGALNGTVTADLGSGATGTTATATIGGSTAAVTSTPSTPPADPAPVTAAPVTAAPVTTAPVTTAPPTPSVPAATTPPAGPAGGATPTAGTAVSVEAAAGTPLATVQLSRSASTVYPVKDGYRDSVRFGVRGLGAGKQAVGVTGTAVLKKAGKTVKSWTLNGATTSITWNGRVGSAVRTGLYTLTVTAWSSDGTTHTATSSVQVLSQHLVGRTVTAKSKVSARSSTAVMPKAVKKALALGRVTVRLRTVATVHGRASLVLASTSTRRSIALRNGTRTTAALTVPKSSSKVTVKHVFTKGTRIISMKAIWSYKTLVR